MYNLPLVRTSVTVAVSLAEILNAATQVIIVHGIELSQSTEIKEAEEEMIQLQWRSGMTAAGTGGNAGVVAIPQLILDAASGCTIRSFDTVKPSGGTIVTHKTWDWNLRASPFIWMPPPEQRLVIAPSMRAALELTAAPTDATTFGGQIIIEAIG